MDENADDRRRSVDWLLTDGPTKSGDRQRPRIDWVLFAPLGLLVCFGAVRVGAANAAVTIPRPAATIVTLAGALALVWASVEADYRILTTTTPNASTATNRWVTPTRLLVVGWAVVSVATLTLLSALSQPSPIATGQFRVVFAVLVLSVPLSSVVAGPLLALQQYATRHA